MNTSTTKANESKKSKREPFFGKFRFCIAILLGFTTFSYTSLRMNLSMGMVGRFIKIILKSLYRISLIYSEATADRSS